MKKQLLAAAIVLLLPHLATVLTRTDAPAPAPTAAVTADWGTNSGNLPADLVQKYNTKAESTTTNTEVDLAQYQRDPVHGYPVNAWKYLKGEEGQRALAEHCQSHLVYSDFAPECAE